MVVAIPSGEWLRHGAGAEHRPRLRRGAGSPYYDQLRLWAKRNLHLGVVRPRLHQRGCNFGLARPGHSTRSIDLETDRIAVRQGRQWLRGNCRSRAERPAADPNLARDSRGDAIVLRKFNLSKTAFDPPADLLYDDRRKRSEGCAYNPTSERERRCCCSKEFGVRSRPADSRGLDVLSGRRCHKKSEAITLDLPARRPNVSTHTDVSGILGSPGQPGDDTEILTHPAASSSCALAPAIAPRRAGARSPRWRGPG